MIGSKQSIFVYHIRLCRKILSTGCWVFLTTASLALGKEVPLALVPIEGRQAATANQTLADGIKASGFFYLAKPEPGAFVAKGRFTRKGLEGELLRPSGKKLFKRTYSGGDLLRDVRQFSDDIVLAATGKPGIATSQIAFIGKQKGKPEIYICDYDGKNIRQITRDGLPKRHPSLSPNGSHLFFVATATGRGGVYRIDLSNDQRTRVADAHGSALEKAVFSPDGKQVAMALAAGGNSDLYIARSNGQSRQRLTDSAVPEFQPSWAPDGKSLVYTAAPAPGKTQLFLIGLKRRDKPQVLPVALPRPGQPCWSPDGHRIAFVSGGTANPRIAVYDLRNRSTRRLVAGQSPTWGADSRHLIYTTGGSLYRIDVDSGKKVRLLDGGGQIYDPTWTR